MNNCTGNYSARLRSRTKQPVYTSDKRAKFAQRENKNDFGQNSSDSAAHPQLVTTADWFIPVIDIEAWLESYHFEFLWDDHQTSTGWIRFVTVLGYIFFVSLPAVSLSIYYIYIWDPGYINKFPPEVINSSLPIHKAAILSTRLERNADPMVMSSLTPHPISSLDGTSGPQSLASESPHRPDLAAILAEGSKSMESSAEVIRSTVGD